MDILIKSFNRPYYLERCLRSIDQFVVGDFQVKILDDGTPSEYLDIIRQKFPLIKILYSPNYEVKVEALNRHAQGEGYGKFPIPSAFWYKIVEESTEIFMLIEDDIWFTQLVDINECERLMLANNMVMLRLSWQGNSNLVEGVKQRISFNVESISPTISFVDKTIFLNKFKFRSVLYRLGLLNSIMQYQIRFYVLYAVASALFNKKYWLYLWKDAHTFVLEEAQLRKASEWYDTTNSAYGKLVNESTQTSYISSTTNGFVEIEFDMVRFNRLLNDAWLRGELNSMQGFPFDFSIDYLSQFLRTIPDYDLFANQWKNWVNRFKYEYRKVGCKVD